MEQFLLDTIPQLCLVDRINVWANDMVGSISGHSKKLEYRFYEATSDGNGNYQIKEHGVGDAPVVAVGFVVFWLQHRRNGDRLSSILT